MSPVIGNILAWGIVVALVALGVFGIVRTSREGTCSGCSGGSCSCASREGGCKGCGSARKRSGKGT
jgi:hypothetical protein